MREDDVALFVCRWVTLTEFMPFVYDSNSLIGFPRAREAICMKLECSDALLSQNASQEQLDRQRKASTKGWDEAYMNTEAGRAAVDAVTFARHDQTVRYVVPWIARHVDLPKTKILDFGSGCGSSALAFSKFSNSVEGFEISSTSVEAARERMKIFGASNVTITESAPDAIMDAALKAVDENTTILFLAVVEHLLESERVDYLKRFWDRIAPGSIIAVVETPNAYACIDTHTFQKPWAHLVPDKYFADWLRRSPPNLRFRADFIAAADSDHAKLMEMRRRYGLAVGPECFELAFGCDLNEVVIADRFDPEILSWFPWTNDDRLLLATFCAHSIELPVGFAGCVLNFIFRKPRNSEEAGEVRLWNAERRRKLVFGEMWGAPAPRLTDTSWWRGLLGRHNKSPLGRRAQF